MQHLADHYGAGPVQLPAIADKQSILAKFLNVILLELTHAGLAESLRACDGILAGDPSD